MNFKITGYVKRAASEITGFGDLTHLAAQPVIRVIKSVFPGFDCGGGCEERRKALNKAFPFKKPPAP